MKGTSSGLAGSVHQLLLRLFVSVHIALCLLDRLRLYLHFGDLFILHVFVLVLFACSLLSLLLFKGHLFGEHLELHHGLIGCLLGCLHCNWLLELHLHLKLTIFLGLKHGVGFDNGGILRLLGVVREMLPVGSDGCDRAVRDFVIAEIQNVGLLDLREDGERVVWLEVGIRRQGVLTLHLVGWVVHTSVKSLEDTFTSNGVQMRGFC